MTIEEAVELEKDSKWTWDGLDKKDLLKNKKADAVEKAFLRGYEAGYIRGRAKTTTQLVNEFYGNGYPHSWFAPVNWIRRTARLKALVDQLWQQYGPVEHDKDDY